MDWHSIGTDQHRGACPRSGKVTHRGASQRNGRALRCVAQQRKCPDLQRPARKSNATNSSAVAKHGRAKRRKGSVKLSQEWQRNSTVSRRDGTALFGIAPPRTELRWKGGPVSRKGAATHCEDMQRRGIALFSHAKQRQRGAGNCSEWYSNGNAQIRCAEEKLCFEKQRRGTAKHGPHGKVTEKRG